MERTIEQNVLTQCARFNSRRDKGSGAAGASRRQLQHTWSSRPLTSAPDITAKRRRETGSAEITTGRRRTITAAGCWEGGSGGTEGFIWSEKNRARSIKKKNSANDVNHIRTHAHCILLCNVCQSLFLETSAYREGWCIGKHAAMSEMSAATHVNKFQCI